MQMKIWTSKCLLSENRCPGEPKGMKEWTCNTGRRRIKFYILYKRRKGYVEHGAICSQYHFIAVDFLITSRSPTWATLSRPRRTGAAARRSGVLLNNGGWRPNTPEKRILHTVPTQSYLTPRALPRQSSFHIADKSSFTQLTFI